MPGETSKTPRRSWKGTGESSSRSGGSNYAWKRGPKQGVEPKLPRSKAARIVTAAASCAAVLGLIICLILMIQPPRPACMTLIGADYATNLMVPHNIFGVEGLRGLEALANRPRRFALLGAKPLRLTRAPLTLDKSEQWDVVIKDLVEKKFSEQTILIALAMHGVSDPEGPYLLPNGTSRPEDRLPLKKVIQDLKKLPKEKDKVLILEAAQIPADWRLGMLHNDFARQLEGLEPEVARVEKLWVLSAAGPDERCWASEGLRRTIFSHFLIEGLAGRAAGTDKRVDLDELYRYVRSRVRDWAWTTRGAVQEPVLLPRVDASGHKLSESGLSARAGRVVLVSTGEPPHFEPPPAPDPSRLEQEWKAFQSLAALTPSPAIYTPRQWRAYRAALVRYDELTRAGAVGPAKELEGRLNVLARNIREGRLLNNLASSAGNSLVFNAVQGGPVDDPSSSKAEFSRLWIAPEANLSKVWQDLQGDEAPAGEAKRRPLRARVDDFLISRAAEDPSKNLGPAALRIDRTKGNDTLPTEAHFLRMLDRHLHAKDRGPKFWGPVRQALAVRRLAERAALGVADTGGPFQYSEQVQPWIKSMIEKADDTRRQAEDLLFSTEPNTWGEAEQSLALAGSLYQRAIERAGHVRAALLLRDRVLADLPDYSRWLAHRLPDELNDALPGIVEKLWDDTHRLVQQLESPGQGSDDGADLDAIKPLVRDIEEALALVQQRFEDQKLAIDRTREPGDWEVADAAAAVAVDHPDFDDFELRRTIWRRLANIGRRDVEDARPDKVTPADPTSAQRDKALKQAMERARVEGRMALAVLGRRWFDDPSFKDREDYKGVCDRVESFQGKADGSTSLAIAGAEIGLRRERLVAEVDRLAFGESGKTDPSSVLARLLDADRHGRLLDGSGAASDSSRESAAKYRARLVHDLLIWLADRTWLDHWYDEDPKSTTPYYKIVGAKYLTDADRLVPDSAAVKGARQRLNRPSRLDLVKSDAIVLTSEWSKPVAYRVADHGSVPPGSPVISPGPGQLLKLDQTDEAAKQERWIAVKRARGDRPAQAAEFVVTCPGLRALEIEPGPTKPRIDETTFDVRGFFRGQIFEARTPVAIHPLPEIRVLGPEPTDSPGTIAVRAQREIVDQFGQGTGAIVIILDCSGSMRFNHKFENARGALLEVLRKTIPAKTMVSIWTYGQLREGFPANSPEAQADHDHPERTIQQILAPVAWDPKLLPGIEQRLASLTPYHETPLVESMVKAKVDLVGRAHGFRTLLVLTDGADSQYPSTKSVASTRRIKDTFTNSGIMINMVLFELSREEKVAAEFQFKDALKALDPPGQLIEANARRLFEILRNSLKQKLICTVRKDDAEAKLVAELDVTDPESEPDNWLTPGLESGAYKFQVQTDRTYQRSIVINKGDRLIVNLVSRPGRGLAFERALYSDDFASKQPFKGADAGGWRLAFLEDRGQIGSDRLQLFATLEPTSSGQDYLGVRKPFLTWFDLSSEFGKVGDFAVRWRERSLYPAPVWQFDVTDWPVDPAGNPSRPIVRAWWNPDLGTAPSASLSRKADFNSPLDLIEKTVPVEDREGVVIESVRSEDHYLVPARGVEPELTPCLVVRLRYPRERPYWVDPKNLPGIDTPSGYEHRFYTRANRYTGLFWPVTREQIESQLNGLSLISLERFQERARDRKYMLDSEGIELKSPQLGSDPPQPPAPPTIPR